MLPLLLQTPKSSCQNLARLRERPGAGFLIAADAMLVLSLNARRCEAVSLFGTGGIRIELGLLINMTVIYAHLPQAVVSLLALLAGSLFFSASKKERTSLDVPLISPHTKAVLGGCLLLCGVAVAVSIFVSR